MRPLLAVLAVALVGAGVAAAQRRSDDAVLAGLALTGLGAMLAGYLLASARTPPGGRRSKGKRPPRVVCLGGGTGLSTLLRGLKKLTPDITAIVTVADDGGSSGRLRRDYAVLPPGDIRNCLAALSAREDLLSRMFQFRFDGAGELSGHSLGNLLLTGLGAITGDFLSAIRVSSEFLAVTGEVLPSTLQPVKLWAVLADGKVIQGESQIPEAGQPIKELHLSLDDAEPTPGVLERIAEADLIVLGPGSLFTSIMPNLLVPRIRRAVEAAKAPVAAVINVMTQPGETDGFTVGDHVRVLREMGKLGRLDRLVVHSGKLDAERRARAAKEGAHPVELDRGTIEEMGERLVHADVASDQNPLRHDPDKLARAVLETLARF